MMPTPGQVDSRLVTWKQFPWFPDVNTTDDVNLMAHSDVLIADQVLIGLKANPEMREGINYNYDSGASSPGHPLIGGKQYFYGTTAPRTDLRVAVDSLGNIYRYTSGGARTTLSAAGALWTNPTRTSFEVFNNALILAADGAGNVPLVYDGTTLQTLQTIASSGVTVPNFSICRVWQGRLWTDDKTDPDLVNYTPPYDQTTWGGVGDSGGLEISIGDGDEYGVSAIFPPFQGTLFIAKRKRLFNVTGTTPMDYDITTVSNGIGCESHNSAIAIDQDDVLFLSRRGVHSLVATMNYGNFEATYISRKIQRSVTQNWLKSRLYAAQGAYIPEVNCAVFAVTDAADNSVTNRSLWFYNIEHKKWFTWHNTQCNAMFAADDQDKTRIYIGQEDGRLAQTFNGNPYDLRADSTKAAISVSMMTGIIYVDNNPETIKAFKRAGLAMTITGVTTVTLNVFIDNFPLQPVVFSEMIAGALLGSTFVLGVSLLGASEALTPEWRTMDGQGRGIQLQILKSDTTSDLSIQGLLLEWEQSGTAQETRY